ncbi:MAG TPA: AAA family ATPase, partial [Thermomicrobiales bacterium]
MGFLSFALLGRTDVRHADAPLVLPTRKALALLVYLATEGGIHPREQLAVLLWPESDQERSRAMLRYTLAALRRALRDSAAAPHLISARDAIGLDFSAGVEVDLHSLEAAHLLARQEAIGGTSAGGTSQILDTLQRAADHYRGEFLADLSLPDAPDFDDWATHWRESCHQKMEVVLDRLAHLQAGRGEIAEAIETARRWVTISPMNEEGYRYLMRLYLSVGDRVAALQAYETCRTILDAELRVTPIPETVALAERIRMAEPLGRAPAHGTARSPDPRVPLEGPLVGRSDEFLKLVERYHAARGRRVEVVILRGEAGIGKTRLAKEFLAWATGHEADVLEGRAFETGGRLPFQPLVDALRPRLERENAPESLLSDVWLTELGRLLPELRDRYPDLPRPTGDEAAARTRLFEAIVRLGQSLTRRMPVVLFVDDVQWADAGSLDLLHYAARRWIESDVPLLLLLSVRAEALADTPLIDEWLLGLRRDLAPTELDLGPLTAQDTLQLVQGFGARSGLVGTTPTADPDLERIARWLFSETSGQPFFAVETIRALLERGTLALRVRDGGGWEVAAHVETRDLAALGTILPPGVREVVRARLARLPHPARELLAAAAVLGQGFTFDQLCRVADLDEDEALSATDVVVRAHLLREAAVDSEGVVGTYAFTHDKIRDVAHAEAGAARQRVFHRRALETLQGSASAAQLARHALIAGLQQPTIEFSLAAGDEALHLLAARDALVHYDRAMDFAARLGRTSIMVELHARRGKTYMSLAWWVEARRELEAALDGLGASQQSARAEVLVDLLEVCWWLLDVPSVRRWASEALALAIELGRGDVETVAHGWLAAAVGADGDIVACVAQYGRALARGDALGIPTPAPLYPYLSLSLYWLGRFEEATRRGDEGVRIARAANHTTAAMFSLPHLGVALAGQGRYDEAMGVFAEARRLGHQYGIETLRARAIAFSAGFHLDLWDFAGNEALAEEARELARSLGFAPPVVSAGIDLLLNFARKQDVGRAERLLGEVVAAAAGVAGWHGWIWGLRL